MPFAPARDIELYYEIHGSGPPVLMISGTGNDLRFSLPDRSPLNRHFETAHYDQRGLGRSSKPDIEYTMGDYADDAAALLDHLGWPRAHVVGVSFGGMVAQNLAVRHPERIDRLVLACTSPGGKGGSSADLLALSSLPPAVRAESGLALNDTRYVPGSDTLPPGLELYADYVANRKQPEPGSPDAIGALRQLQARGTHDVYEDLASVANPTLVIGGRYDGIAPPSNLRAITAEIANAEMVLCDGGHLFLLQDRTAWPRIIEFLQNRTGPDGGATLT